MNLDQESNNGLSNVQLAQERVYDRFEAQWQQNSSYQLENLIPQIDDIVRPLSVDPNQPGFVQQTISELIRIEMDLKNEARIEIDRFEYYRRFPDFVSVIDKSLDRVNEASKELFNQVVTVSVVDSLESNGPGKYDIDRHGKEQIPCELGPFQDVTEIGSGGFGIVCSALDSRHGRQVALKFPRKKVIANKKMLQMFLDEAERVMKLDHSGIVKTYSVEKIDGYLVIVQQLIVGTDLRTSLNDTWTHRQIAELTAALADALAYASRQRIVHRDLKPANILLDHQGRPYITDFGMALDENDQLGAPNMRCGTVPYMCPQLVAGLTRNLDGRADIWSLGVILYQMLVGQRPFRGKTERDIFTQIETCDPRPLRQIDPSVPKELQRICLKCLERAPRHRYLTADELADDLRHWISKPDHAKGDRQEAVFVPKGLRSYGADDADFFLELLPGPRDRDNIPASVRFWSSRICEPIPQENRVPVGVIYGPSGSGKSSFVKAGLLPRVNRQVEAVYIESTQADTEVRLLKALRNRFPEIPVDASLPEMLRGLSHGNWQPPGKKTLIVLDQFEQRLSQADDYEHSQLAKALRHCDGERLQCLLLIRDDFWLALTRFTDALEMDLLEGRNSQDIDLFERAHAKKVLIQLGRAYGRLPDEPTALSSDQQKFLDSSIEQMSVGSYVICVRLILFAEMFKSRPWSMAELKSGGGAKGVGEKFLEDTFGANGKNRRYQIQRDAAQAVLEVLLPEAGSDIRGSMKSEDDLVAAANLGRQPGLFRELVRSLDHELKLITRTDPDSFDGHSKRRNQHETSTKYYQLTHDYLVPSLRAWLTTEMAKSFRGRAELRLRELSDLHLSGRRATPGFLELVRMTALVPRHRRSESGKKVVRQGWKHYRLRLACAVFLLIAIGISGFYLNENIQSKAALSSKQALLDCIPSEFGQKLEQARPFQSRLRTDFVNLLNDPDPRVRLRAAIAISEFFDPDSHVLDEVVSSLPRVEADQIPNIRRALSNWPSRSLFALDAAFQRTLDGQAKAKFALMSLALGNSKNAEELFEDPSDPSSSTILIHMVRDWHLDLQRLAKATRRSDQPAFQYGMIIAVGRIDPDTLRPNEFDAWSNLVHEFFPKHEDSGVHSACAWLATKWPEIKLPKLNATETPQPNMNWWVKAINGTPLTLIRINGQEFGGPTFQNGEPTIGQEVWVCDRELPFELVGEWASSLEDSDARRVALESHPLWKQPIEKTNIPFYAPTIDCALSGNDLIEVSNWLSVSDGLTTCYDRTLVDKNNGFYWSLKRGPSKGYRALTWKEWQYVCGAGSDPEIAGFFWGNKSLKTMASEYGNRQEMRLDKNEVSFSGNYIPNKLGFFDIVGNVYEYCVGDSIKEDGKVFCHAMGGNCSSQLWEMLTDEGGRTTSVDARRTYMGLRLVYVPDIGMRD